MAPAMIHGFKEFADLLALGLPRAASSRLVEAADWNSVD